nr:hypothetical protein [Thiocapsa sp. KS1]
MTDDKESVQEFLPRDAEGSSASKKGAGKEIEAQGSRPRFIEVMRGTTYGLRKQKQKVDAQNDLIRSYREAEKELHALMQTAKHLEQQEIILQGEFEAKRAEHRHLASRRNLDEQRLQREIKEEGYKQEIQDLEQQVKKASLELQLEEIKLRRLELQGRAIEPQKEVVDPHVEQARTEIKRYMDRHQYLGRDKKQWFTQIDGDLESGEISKDLAKWMKEDIEQIIRDNTLSP